MADPTEFAGQNTILKAPDGMEDSVRDLPAHSDGAQYISCWKLTPEELETVKATGCVWISIFGRYIPPVFVSGTPLVEVHFDA